MINISKFHVTCSLLAHDIIYLSISSSKSYTKRNFKLFAIPSPRASTHRYNSIFICKCVKHMVSVCRRLMRSFAWYTIRYHSREWGNFLGILLHYERASIATDIRTLNCSVVHSVFRRRTFSIATNHTYKIGVIGNASKIFDSKNVFISFLFDIFSSFDIERCDATGC